VRDDLPIRATCGVQYPGERPDCPICDDERRYVGWDGQRWTSLAELHAAGHRGEVREEGPDVVGVGAEPGTFIGRRALPARTAAGNVLWDMTTYVDDVLVERVRALELMEPFSFERVYGAWWGRIVDSDGVAAISRSARRYLDRLVE
jgi:hypothetical protein